MNTKIIPTAFEVPLSGTGSRLSALQKSLIDASTSTQSARLCAATRELTDDIKASSFSEAAEGKSKQASKQASLYY